MRLLLQILGFLILLIGIAFTMSPMPFGFTLMVIGASIIVANNAVVARWLRHERMRHPLFDRLFESIEQMLPQNWRVDGGSVYEDFSSTRRPPGEG